MLTPGQFAAAVSTDCLVRCLFGEEMPVPPRDGGEHGPVRPVQARTWVGATEHSDLVPQHKKLDVLGGGRATRQQDQPEHLAKESR
jgi:hypothetical protein